ncbi:MAG: DNA/RNA non-specific endonuclease [Oceanospirillaceae bacterium]|nr:DNA/RNA non-specific endonuclease [Oceanospirillaceae bacterium]
MSSCQSCSNSGRNSLREESNQRGRRHVIEPREEEEVRVSSPPQTGPSDESDSPGDAGISGTDSPSLSQLYEELNPAVLYITAKHGNEGVQGSGFIIDKGGICVSNYHVFENARLSDVTVYINRQGYRVSRVLESNPSQDFIIFKLATNRNDLPSLSVARNVPRVGEDVFAIGNPKGLEKTLSTGVVSQLRPNMGLIQTTTEITHGSSGGPLFNMEGQVVGITTSGFDEANLNFAVDIQLLPYSKYVSRSISSSSISPDYLPRSNASSIVNHQYFSLSYHEATEQPLWVAYKLTEHNLIGRVSRTNDFREDPSIITGSATLSDYKYSGYDRGHLAPAGSMTQNEEAMSESFLLSNMSPQLHSFNAGVWLRLENFERSVVPRFDSIYVIVGGVFKDNLDTIGDNDVVVPGYYYRVLLGFRSLDVCGIGFILPHESTSKDIFDFACTIDRVEEFTGIDMSAGLSQEAQIDVESVLNVERWN